MWWDICLCIKIYGYCTLHSTANVDQNACTPPLHTALQHMAKYWNRFHLLTISERMFVHCEYTTQNKRNFAPINRMGQTIQQQQQQQHQQQNQTVSNISCFAIGCSIWQLESSRLICFGGGRGWHKILEFLGNSCSIFVYLFTACLGFPGLNQASRIYMPVDTYNIRNQLFQRCDQYGYIEIEILHNWWNASYA